MVEVHLRGEAEGGSYGKFKFEHLPSPGDRVVIANNYGSCDVLTVLYVEHTPIAIPLPPLALPTPFTTVYVEYHSSFGD